MAGRKKIEIDLKEVEKHAESGLSESQIAQAMGYSWDTLNRRKNENADFAHAIKKGRAKGIAHVTNRLFEIATDKKQANVGAICFYLKCVAGWRDKPDEIKAQMSMTQEDAEKIGKMFAEQIKNIPLVDKDGNLID